MKKLHWYLTVLFGFFGFLLLLISFSGNESAKDTTVFLLMGLAFSVIPYCIAKAIDEIKKCE
jgi:hypothetical protein